MGFCKTKLQKLSVSSDKLNERITLLRQSKLLEHAGAESIEKIARAMSERFYKAGEVILRQGQPGDHVYYIKRGTILVWQKRGELDELVNQRQSNEFIGELALLTKQPRNATCTALTDVELLSLAKADFESLLEPFFRLQAEQSRRQSNLQALQQLPGFGELNRVYLAHLSQLGRYVRYNEGDILLSTSHPPTPPVFLIILSGTARLFASNFRQEKLRSRGYFFATGNYEFSLPSGVTIVAAPGGLEVLEISCDTTFESLLSNPALARWIKKTVRRFETE